MSKAGASAAAARGPVPLFRLDLGGVPEAGGSISGNVKLAALRQEHVGKSGGRKKLHDRDEGTT